MDECCRCDVQKERNDVRGSDQTHNRTVGHEPPGRSRSTDHECKTGGNNKVYEQELGIAQLYSSLFVKYTT